MKQIHTYESYINFLEVFYTSLSDCLFDDLQVEKVIYIYFYARGRAGFFEEKYSKGTCQHALSMFEASDMRTQILTCLNSIKSLLDDIKLFQQKEPKFTPLDYSYLSIKCHIGYLTASFNVTKQLSDRTF